MNIKHIATLTAAVAGMFAAGARADVEAPAALEQADDESLFSAEIALDVSSRQLTRGMVDDKDPIFELGAQVGVGGLYFNATGIFDLTD